MDRVTLKRSRENAAKSLPGPPLDEAPLKMRRLNPLNLTLRLRQRTVHGRRKNRCVDYSPRCFYPNIVPDFTVMDVEKPPSYTRKFTPDGKYLIAFSWDQTAVEIYNFRGSSAAEELLKSHTGEGITSWDQQPEKLEVRSKLFETLFTLKHRVVTCTMGLSHLNRECSLFTEDGKYVMVAASRFTPESEVVHAQQPMHFKNSESLYPNGRFLLESYTFYLVHLENGYVTDSIFIPGEKIVLPHNQGLYLYQTTLAILTLCQQEIHIYEIPAGVGRFTFIRKIGLFCYEDDRLFWESTVSREERMEGSPKLPVLKHRLMVHLYKKAVAKARTNPRSKNVDVRLFFRHFPVIQSMRIWKMQLLNEDTIFLRLAAEDVVSNRALEPNSRRSLFIVYQISSTKVLSAWENSSADLLEIYEKHCDEFRNITGGRRGLPMVTTSPSNNLYERIVHERYKETITHSRCGGPTEAIRRCLAPLPIPAQSFTLSPYLDRDLFSYDDRFIIQMERPKMCGEVPIRFYHREHETLAFRLHPSVPVTKRLIAFTFHPIEPLALSVQKTMYDFQLNVHLRHSAVFQREVDFVERQRLRRQRARTQSTGGHAEEEALENGTEAALEEGDGHQEQDQAQGPPPAPGLQYANPPPHPTYILPPQPPMDPAFPDSPNLFASGNSIPYGTIPLTFPLAGSSTTNEHRPEHNPEEGPSNARF